MSRFCSSLSLVPIFTVIYCLWGSIPSWADASLTQEIDPPAIHLGDTAKVTISVTDGWVMLLDLPKVEGLTIARLGHDDFTATAEHRVVITKFSVIPTHTGDFTIPGFDAKTQTHDILHFQPITLHVLDPGQNIPPQLLVPHANSSNTTDSTSATNSDATPTLPGQATIHPLPQDQPASPTTPSPGVIQSTNTAPVAPILDNSAPNVPEFADQSPLDAVQQAAIAKNPSAEYQLAMRLLNGSARSQAATQLINDLTNQLQDSKPGIVVVSLNHQRLQLAFIDNDDPKQYEGVTEVQAYYEKKENLKKLCNTIVEKEIAQALPLLKDSADQNYLDALRQLSLYYAYGTTINFPFYGKILSTPIVPVDTSKAFQLAKQAAASGWPRGLNLIALYYATGIGITKDINKGAEYFQMARAKGNPQAYINLAKLSIYGGLEGRDDGYPKNPQQAYILSRAIQIAFPQDSQLNQVASAEAQKAQTNLQPEELLSAETQAEAEAEHLESLPKNSTGTNPKPKLSSAPTKDQWRAEIEGLIAGGQLVCKKDRLLAVVGQPDRTETVGDEIYLYWKCSDGEIQVVSSATAYNYAGLLQAQVNDY